MVSQFSTLAGRQLLSHSRSLSADDFSNLQILRIESLNTSEGLALYPRGRQTPPRRQSLATDDVLTVGSSENIKSSQPINSTSASRLPLRRSVSCATAYSKPMAVEKVQRWSGMTRTVSVWDGLRRVSAPRPLTNHQLTLPRTANCGLRMVTAMCISMRRELLDVAHLSVFPSALCDRRSVLLCSMSVSRRLHHGMAQKRNS